MCVCVCVFYILSGVRICYLSITSHYLNHVNLTQRAQCTFTFCKYLIYLKSIETPYLLIILTLKFEIVHPNTSNVAIYMTSSVDQDQMLQNAASDLVLHCL